MFDYLDLPDRPKETVIRKHMKVKVKHTLKLASLQNQFYEVEVIVSPAEHIKVEYYGVDDERTLLQIVDKVGVKTETLYGRLLSNKVEYIPTLVSSILRVNGSRLASSLTVESNV